MTDLSHIQARIRGILSDKLFIDPPPVETNLFEAAILDSLMFASLLAHLEEDLGVRIVLENLEIENFSSISKIAEFVTAQNSHKDYSS
jgi:acyl carrier protein